MHISTLFGAAAAVTLMTAAPALAQNTGGGAPTIFGRSLSVSLKARVAPDYMGSDDYKISPAGSISLYLPGEDATFSAPDDGISMALFGNENLSAGVTGRFRSGRDNDDDLRGFEEIDYAVEVGGYVNFWPTGWLRTRAEARKGFGGHEGVVVDLGADMVSRSEALTLSIGPRVRWADDEYAQTYFGVTAREAARSPYGIAAYNPDGGASYAGALASAEYKWNARWALTADAQWNRLMGDTADSPIVKTLGSEDQFAGSVGVRYRFGG